MAQLSPLHNVAERLGANFQEWYGWKLPASYGDVLAEYRVASEGVAIHDASYVGRLKATGKDALDLLHRLSTNALLTLKPGEGAATVLTNENSRIVDLITVLNFGEYLLLFTSPEARDKIARWIDKYTIMEDVTIKDITPVTAMLSLMGPKTPTFLASLVSQQIEPSPPYNFMEVVIAGVKTCVTRKDLLGITVFHVIVSAEDAEKVWEKCLASGAVPAGMEAYEALRVEKGVPIYGKELSEAYNPLEAGLMGVISFTKGCYIGQEVIARLETYKKVQRHLVSLSFSPAAEVQEGTKLTQGNMEVGSVTSVVKVPTTAELVGLGYVRKSAAEVGTRLSLANREDTWAEVKALVQSLGPGE